MHNNIGTWKKYTFFYKETYACTYFLLPKNRIHVFSFYKKIYLYKEYFTRKDIRFCFMTFNIIKLLITYNGIY